MDTIAFLKNYKFGYNLIRMYLAVLGSYKKIRLSSKLLYEFRGLNLTRNSLIVMQSISTLLYKLRNLPITPLSIKKNQT